MSILERIKAYFVSRCVRRRFARYFISYLSETGHGSCEMILNKKPGSYQDLQEIAKMIENKYSDQKNVIIMYWQTFA